MAKITFKHELKYKGGEQKIKVAADADALVVQKFSDKPPYLYSMGNPDTGEQELTIILVSETGAAIKDNWTHIGTFFENQNAVHVFVVQ